ncbi:hypothetical protein FRC01_004369, partial [Tulasnella sp. 417]
MDWMKDIVCKDPMNSDNPSMVGSFKAVFPILPQPDPLEPELQEQPDDPKVVYYQLYTTLLKTMSEIEAVLPPEASSPSE